MKLAIVAAMFSLAAVLPATAQTRPAPPATPPRDTRAVAPAGTAVIRGRVVSADTGRPLTLATITASTPELREPRSISTNSEGRYELRSLPAGRYTLSVARSGYLRLQYGQRRPLELGTPIDVAASAVVDNVDFVLPRMSVISGRVMDEEGQPMAGIPIAALPATAYGERRFLPPIGIGFVSTDDSGGYRISGLLPGSYAVMANTTGAIFTSKEGGVTRSDGYAPTYFPGVANPSAARLLSIGIGEEAANTDFSILPARLATVTGTLVDSRGQPVVNQPVTVVRQIAGVTGFIGPLAARTNEAGAFTLRNLAPGPITIVAGAGPASREAAIVTMDIDGADVDQLITTSAGWSLSGRVATDEGPVPAAWRNGLTLFANPAGNALRGIRINNVGGPEAGRVSDAGAFAVTGIFGPARVAVSGLPAGWFVKEILNNGHDISGKPVETRDGGAIPDLQVVLSNRLTKVAGQVSDANGAALSSGTVLLFADDPDRWFEGSRFVRAARPNATGLYEITGLPPGDYRAVAVDYVTERMWNDPDYLALLRPSATMFTLGHGESRTMALKLLTP